MISFIGDLYVLMGLVGKNNYRQNKIVKTKVDLKVENKSGIKNVKSKVNSDRAGCSIRSSVYSKAVKIVKNLMLSFQP